MKQNSLLKILMWAIIPISLTLIFFTTVNHGKSGMWISLVFIWISYFTVSVTCISKWGKELSILNWTLYLCAIKYFLAELVVAVLFLYVYSDYPQWSFAIQLLLFVFYVLLFGMMYIANQKTDQQIQEFHINDSKVKNWRVKVASMLSNNPSKELKELSDLLNVTPAVSTPEVSSIDDEITTMINSGMSNTAIIINKIKERNIILKYSQI